MKLTIYCDKDLVLRYRPDGWPKEPKKVTEFESYAGTVYCGGDFGYEKAMNKYTEALQKAKYDSVPFEDQKQIWDLVCSYNAFTKHAQKDNFYDLEINGTVYIINNSHDGRSFAGIVPSEPSARSERTLTSFYDWYREANAATREDVLNELKRRLEIE